MGGYTWGSKLKSIRVRQKLDLLQDLCKHVRSGPEDELHHTRYTLDTALKNVRRTRLSTPVDAAEEEFIRAYVRLIDTRFPPLRVTVTVVRTSTDDAEQELLGKKYPDLFNDASPTS